MTEVRFDADVFKRAGETISSMKAGKQVDLSPVEEASRYLDGYGKTLEEFLETDAVARSLLWSGAQKICRRSRTDRVLFSVVREMVGSTRDIRKANGKLDRTHVFLTKLGSIGK